MLRTFVLSTFALGLLMSEPKTTHAQEGSYFIGRPFRTSSMELREITFWAADALPESNAKPRPVEPKLVLRKWVLRIPIAYISAIAGKSSPRLSLDRTDNNLLVNLSFIEQNFSPTGAAIAGGTRSEYDKRGVVELTLQNALWGLGRRPCGAPKFNRAMQIPGHVALVRAAYDYHGWQYSFGVDVAREVMAGEVSRSIGRFLDKYTLSIDEAFSVSVGGCHDYHQK